MLGLRSVYLTLDLLGATPAANTVKSLQRCFILVILKVNRPAPNGFLTRDTFEVRCARTDYHLKTVSAIRRYLTVVHAAFVRRAVAKLSKAKLPVATRGRNGRRMLSRVPGEISLLEIYRASEAPPVRRTLISRPEGMCSQHPRQRKP